MKTEQDLIDNLRIQLENLNNRKFDEDKWKRFFIENISNNQNHGIKKRLEITQGQNYRINWKGEDWKFIDKWKHDNNFLQVIEIGFYEGQSSIVENDLLILFNGIPAVWIEIRNGDLEEEFLKPKKLSSGTHKLLEFTQIFIITNGKETKYYPVTLDQKANSFTFTSFWSTIDNLNHERRQLKNPIDFSDAFLNQRKIRKILVDYCVLTNSKDLRVLRPYQIEAIEAILGRIANKEIENAGGYIWHTTGSGKTLTAFKAIQLVEKYNPQIKKILFVVDRRILDDQTFKEFGKFSEGWAKRALNSSDLVKKLKDQNQKIIITTIQKISKLSKEEMYKKFRYSDRVAIFIDECHRSQSGAMREDLLSHFKKSHIFGFTGTPLFEVTECRVNEALSLEQKNLTLETFSKELHSYKLSEAFKDKAVITFNFERWESTDQELDMSPPDEDGELKQTSTRDKRSVVKWIINNFDKKTCGRKFNSIFATRTKQDAASYYLLIKSELAKPENINKQLKIAIVYSPEAGPLQSSNQKALYDLEEEFVEPESEGDDFIEITANQFLREAVAEYNRDFNTFKDISEGIEAYRDDVARRVKNKELDILIVVDMFLTGFDAPCVNTLFLDKRIDKEHNLIQTCSRTNRIYTKEKTFGNIVSFSKDIDLESLERAIKMYSDSPILAPKFEEQYEEYKHLVNSCKQINSKIINKEPTDNPSPEELDSDIKDLEEFTDCLEKTLKIHHNLKQYSQFYKEDVEKLSDEELEIFRSHFRTIKNYREMGKTVLLPQTWIHLPTNLEADNDSFLEIKESKIIDLDKLRRQIEKLNNFQDPIKKQMLARKLLNVMENAEGMKGIQESVEECINTNDNDLAKVCDKNFDKDANSFTEEYDLNLDKFKNYLQECNIRDRDPEFDEKITSLLRNKSVSYKNPTIQQNNEEIRQNSGKFYEKWKAWIKRTK